MDKLKMHSLNKVDENIEKIGRLFPNCLTERKGENGEVEYAIDFDMLKQELSSVVVEGNEERYQFTWPDKKKSVLLANAPIAKTLRPCREESVDFDNTENLYIEGDNLDVLKLLQETYLGKVKMIYIDPPYNTGNDFVYEDDFAKSTDEYLENSGQFDDEGNRLVKNLDSNGRFHTDWLNMIYPRLKLAKDLLSDDGIIFISIDDNEVAQMRKVCDEVFGASNIVANFIIVSNSAKNNSKFVSVTHEYLLCIAKNKEATPVNWVVSKTNSDSFKKISQRLLSSGKSFDEIHSELLALVKYPKFYEFDHYTYVDKRGPFRASDLTAPGSKAKYDVLHPQTGKPCKVGTRGWAYSVDEMNRLIKEDYLLFGEDETVMPQLKNYLFENEKTLPKSVLFFDSQSSTKWMKAQEFGFDFPKAIDYISYVISMYPDDDFTILDFFSGSATTAHAVMQLNAEDGGNRRFIMVQLPEETDEKSEAYKAGYENICEIGKERIRRAGAKIKEENPMTTQNLDTGFRVLKLDSTNMKDVYYNPADYEADLFSTLTDNIKDDRTAEDLLFQVMLDLGVLLSSKIEESTIAGKKVFDVADGFLIACFDENVTEETITAIAQKEPYYFVMRDSSMANDNVATNFEQIFATYSPETVRKVL
ncbi:site-specific DNA-methyltransferase [Eubacteriales bacterium OttesenSCG-928-N14]|nr:site-specific DNA-methyltransferase [Eubacteriales bacterium OttesenSCG-928-N14]